MKLIIQLSIVVYSAILLSSCESGGLEAGRPGYLRIDSFNVSYPDPSNTALGASVITDAWVYLDGDLLSVMPLPGEIPIPELGNRTLTIGPGIRLNGIAATRDEYPFYTRIDTSLTVIEEGSIVLAPTVTYVEELDFQFVEDFENSVIALDSANGSDIQPSKVSIDGADEVFGNFVGYGALDTAKTDMKFVTNRFMTLPQGGTPVFMEIDYKTNALMIIGITYEDNEGRKPEYPYLFLQSTDRETGTPEWKKVYVELTDQISNNQDARSFGFTISGAHETDNELTEFYFDNIKIIHR